MASSLSLPNTGITSVHQPAFFFRGRQPRRFSNSSSSSNDIDGGSDDDNSSSSSSSSSASSRSSFSHSNNSWTASSASTSASGNSTRSLTPAPTPSSKAPVKRQHLKLSLAYVRTRQALQAPVRWDVLASSLKGLSTAIPADLSTLGVCIPILERLGSDLVELLGGDDLELGRNYRKGLGKDDAKALVGLRQRWGGMTGGKGKGKPTENDWYPTILSLVSKNPPPPYMSKPYSAATSCLLRGLESLLLPSSLPRLNLSGQNLTDESMEVWETLLRSAEVLDWYLSFEEQSQIQAQGVVFLDSVRGLDLSKNSLKSTVTAFTDPLYSCTTNSYLFTGFPSFLPVLFPNLETLSLSNNQFRHLPPEVTLFPHLRRLRTHGNFLSRAKDGTTWNAKKLAEKVQEKWTSAGNLRCWPMEVRVESLVDLATRALQASSSPNPASLSSFSDIPLHLSTLVTQSYICASCQHFISFTSPAYLPPLFERIHHLDPGVNIPEKVKSSNRDTGMENSQSSFPSSLRPPIPIPPESSLPEENFPPLPSFRPNLPSHVSPAVMPNSSQVLGPAVHPSPVIPNPRDPNQPQVLSLEEKVFLALLGRGSDLPCYVIGDSSNQKRYSFCVTCAAGHLGLGLSYDDGSGECRCWCRVCKGEAKVRKGGDGERRVMRWLRRRVGSSLGDGHRF